MKDELKVQLPLFTLTRLLENTLFRMVYPFLPVISRGLGVSFAQTARALSLRSLAGLFGTLLASISDSRGRKQGMLLGLSLFLSGLVLVIFWPTFPGFVIMLVLTSIGKMVFDPSMQAFLGDRVPYRRRGFVLAMTELSWSAAFFLGVPAAGFLIARAGWLAPFPLLAGLLLIALLMIIWIIPGDPSPQLGRPSLRQNFAVVAGSKTALAGLGVTLFISIANEMVNLVFGVWLEDSFGLQVAAIGGAAAVIGLSELGGEGLVGLVADRMGVKRAVALGILGTILAALLLPWLGRSVPGALAGLFLFYLAFEFTFVSCIPLMSEVLPGARATLMAVNMAAAFLGRAGAAWLAPLVYALGFPSSALAAGAINLLALFVLRYVKVAGEEKSRK